MPCSISSIIWRTSTRSSPACLADARAFLRDGTRAEHDRVDALFARLDLSARDDYVRFLVAQWRALQPVEQVLEREGIGALVPGWDARAAALQADLHALDAQPHEPLPAPSLDGTPALLGAWYVLEGSRLGGRLLARQVGPDFPRAFLSAGGRGWGKSVELLNMALYGADDLTRALGAARSVFLLFERAARDLD